jgi:integrase
MPRRIRDAKLDTRSARAKLERRREPYWRNIAGGLAIGYRKGATGGTWIARLYSAGRSRRYQSIGAADDIANGDGIHIFSFAQAQTLAHRWLGEIARQDRGLRFGPYTVGSALDDYSAFLESDNRTPRTINDTRYRIEALIRPQLGNLDCTTLTTEQLREWRDNLAKTPARARTRPDSDARRKRAASANRTWTIVRAALNYAFHNGRLESDLAWRRVKPLGGVHSARIRYLTVPEAKRLLNACEPCFRLLVRSALETGCRYGELVRLVASDFNSDAGTLAIHQSKSGKPRHVILTEEGAAFFRQLCAGRSGSELMFRRPNGERWGDCNQLRPMRLACQRAKIDPPVGFHQLRHSWASLAVMNNVPLMVVARNLGHVDSKMVERFYGHLAPSYVAEEIRKGAPRFGITPSKKVVALRS